MPTPGVVGVFRDDDRQPRRLGRSVRLPCHELNAPFAGPRKIEMGHVNALHFGRRVVHMKAAIGVTMNFFFRNGVRHWPKWRVGFGCEMRFGSLQVEYPNQDLRAFDELALFCNSKGETILPNDELSGGNQRLESIIRAHNIGSADNLYRDLKDGCEDYAEAPLHRLSTPGGATNHFKGAEVALTRAF